MKIIYNGRPSKRRNVLPDGQDDVLELLSNDWNDYGFETTFMTVCRINGERVELGNIRILFEHSGNSRAYLDSLLLKGWDGEFPLTDDNYISTPSEISFYEQLDGALSNSAAVDIAEKLRDASYLSCVLEDRDAQELINTTGFESSLQRERGSIEAFNDGWKILDREALAAKDVTFEFEDVYGNDSVLHLKFAGDQTALPREINVLIGANGAGKSQVLHQLVDSWIADTAKDLSKKRRKQPVFSRLIVVSYSPFEMFPLDMNDSGLKDLDAYKYFGLRGRPAQADTDTNPTAEILSGEIPRKDTIRSLLYCAQDDQRFRHIRGWGKKIHTAERILKAAIGFDVMALKICGEINAEKFFTDDDYESFITVINEAGYVDRYVHVTAENVDILHLPRLVKNASRSAGVAFIKDGQLLELSSGQRLFTFLVLNVLGAIRRNSLILIDEPELFLHPSLEILLIDMLKAILHSFNSRAVLATHSVSIVREVPSDCVHVMERARDQLIIKKPPFQTFGGDVQRIASYVFGDTSTSKPFEAWIAKRLDVLTAEQLIDSLEGQINEELVIQIHAMEREQW